MNALSDRADLRALASPCHVCWVVDEPGSYLDGVGALLTQGGPCGEKSVLFGPHLSDPLTQLRSAAVVVADPYRAFLTEGELDPETMFAMFREQTSLARTEGYTALRVVADMDWLLPAHPTPAAIIGFEVLLDRVVTELGATVICAYRRTSFDAETVLGVAAVHPVDIGSHDRPQFHFVAGTDGSWRLSGEIDIAVHPAFAAAIQATVTRSCVLDVTELAFIDIIGLRTIADTARNAKVAVALRGVRPFIDRVWQLSGFHTLAPNVTLTP